VLAAAGGNCIVRTALADDILNEGSDDDNTHVFTVKDINSSNIAAGLIALVKGFVGPESTAASSSTETGGPGQKIWPRSLLKGQSFYTGLCVLCATTTHLCDPVTRRYR